MNPEQQEAMVRRVQAWRVEKGITNPNRQMAKVAEEFGELCGAHAKQRPIAEVRDAVGDVMVTVIVLADIYGVDVYWAMEEAPRFAGEPDSDAALRHLGVVVGHLWEATHAVNLRPVAAEAMFATLAYAASRNLDGWGCLEDVYQVIAPRTGAVKEGVFVKASDLAQPQP